MDRISRDLSAPAARCPDEVPPTKDGNRLSAICDQTDDSSQLERERFWTEGVDALSCNSPCDGVSGANPVAGEGSLTLSSSPAGAGEEPQPAASSRQGAGEPRRKAYCGEPCCLGVDLPGVGPVHSEDCPACSPFPKALAAFLDEETNRLKSSISSAHAALDDCVERNRERRGLWGELLFAARELAEPRVFRGWSENVKSHCAECGGVPIGYTEVRHTPTCCVGRVLAAIKAILDFDGPRVGGAAQGGAQ